MIEIEIARRDEKKVKMKSLLKLKFDFVHTYTLSGDEWIRQFYYLQSYLFSLNQNVRRAILLFELWIPTVPGKIWTFLFE